jgi:hypothetical protein
MARTVDLGAPHFAPAPQDQGLVPQEPQRHHARVLKLVLERSGAVGRAAADHTQLVGHVAHGAVVRAFPAGNQDAFSQIAYEVKGKP